MKGCVRKFQTHRLCALLVVLGVLSICAISCVCEKAARGEPCDTDDDCCTGHCSDEGACCSLEGAVLEEDENSLSCCSGRTRLGDSGPYCCAWTGEVVGNEDECCEGLYYVPRVERPGGTCETSCPAGCSPSEDILRLGECICPGGGGTVQPRVRCAPCEDPDEPDCWRYTVYTEDYRDGEFELGEGCLVLTFYAEDQEEAETCARALAEAQGLSQDWPWVIEEYEDDFTCLPNQ